MALQGNGKVRLIAKKGRFRETDFTNRIRDLMANSTYTGYGETPQQQAQSVLNQANAANGVYNNALLNGYGLENYYIEFDATPEITESGSASYFEASEVRGPGSILMYMGSPSRNFSINAKLIARNAWEARKVDAQIHILKSWRMPESYTGGIDAGTPATLFLQGYGKMFKDIPVVMTDLSIEFSSEHDYLKTGDGSATVAGGTAVPVITTVSISLKEAHSTEGNVDGLDGFDILKYRTGNLAAW